jgi:stage II sporulation protein P
MKFSKITKLIYIFMWTGIFILSSYIIVKGGTSPLIARIGIELLKKGSGFLSYYGEAKEVSKEEKSPLVVEYEEETPNPESFLYGESYYEEEKEDDTETKKKNEALIEELKETKDTDFLLKNFYIVDSTTSVDKEIFQVEKLLKKDMTMKKEEEAQILIFHTHGGSENFSDSRENEKEDSVIGVGEVLAKELRTLGYTVIHDTTEYDKIDGSIDRNKAYAQSLKGVQSQLKKYPSIEVIIDLHRDGVAGNKKRVTEIDGKKTATLMMFNGLSRSKTGEIAYLKNENLQANLAFSLQLRLKAMELYPTLTTANYLKGYRYNMHLCEKFLLIELGNQNSTVSEAKNAMEPFAKVLSEVLEGEK